MALYPLPPTTDFITTGETKGTFKSALSGLRAFLNSLLGADGAQATALSTLGALLNGTVAVSAAGTVVGATHRGKVIDCTGSGGWTLAIDAIATLAPGGAGFSFGVRNGTTGTITVNPNLSEAIDGVPTIDLFAGDSCLVTADDTGAGWRTVGRTSTRLATAANNGAMSAAYASKLDGIQAGAIAGVSKDQNYANVGSYCFCMYASGATLVPGSTLPGSALYAGAGGDNINGIYVGRYYAVTLPGTWRAVSGGNSIYGNSTYALFQRIA